MTGTNLNVNRNVKKNASVGLQDMLILGQKNGKYHKVFPCMKKTSGSNSSQMFIWLFHYNSCLVLTINVLLYLEKGHVHVLRACVRSFYFMLIYCQLSLKFIFKS